MVTAHRFSISFFLFNIFFFSFWFSTFDTRNSTSFFSSSFSMADRNLHFVPTFILYIYLNSTKKSHWLFISSIFFSSFFVESGLLKEEKNKNKIYRFFSFYSLCSLIDQISIFFTENIFDLSLFYCKLRSHQMFNHVNRNIWIWMCSLNCKIFTIVDRIGCWLRRWLFAVVFALKRSSKLHFKWVLLLCDCSFGVLYQLVTIALAIIINGLMYFIEFYGLHDSKSYAVIHKKNVFVSSFNINFFSSSSSYFWNSFFYLVVDQNGIV